MFDDFVAQDTNPLTKWIFLKEKISNNQSTNYDYVDAAVENIRTFASETATGALSQYDDGTIFYFVDNNVFKVYSKTNANLTLQTGYKAYQGRDKLVFQYVHSADENNRLDPSSSNIIDTYLLTKTKSNENKNRENKGFTEIGANYRAF